MTQASGTARLFDADCCATLASNVCEYLKCAAGDVKKWHHITCESGISACHQSSIVAFLASRLWVEQLNVLFRSSSQYWVGLVLHGFSPALVIIMIMITNKSIQLRPNPVNPHKRNKWNSKKPRDCPFHPPAKGGVEIFSASVMFSEVVPPGKKIRNTHELGVKIFNVRTGTYRVKVDGSPWNCLVYEDSLLIYLLVSGLPSILTLCYSESGPIFLKFPTQSCRQMKHCLAAKKKISKPEGTAISNDVWKVEQLQLFLNFRLTICEKNLYGCFRK